MVSKLKATNKVIKPTTAEVITKGCLVPLSEISGMAQRAYGCNYISVLTAVLYGMVTIMRKLKVLTAQNASGK